MATLKLNRLDARRLCTARDEVVTAVAEYAIARESFEDAATEAARRWHLDDGHGRPYRGRAAVGLAEALLALHEEWLAGPQADCEASADGLESLGQELQQELQERWDEKSERWQESDDGSATQQWIESLGAFEAPHTSPIPTRDDLAERLDVEGSDASGAIEALVCPEWADTVLDEAEAIEPAPEC